MIEILKNKWFWIIPLIIGAFGALIVLFEESDYDRIENSSEKYICQFEHRFKMSAPGLKDLDDIQNIVDYQNLIEGSSNLGPKNLTGVEYGKVVHVYKTSNEYNLSQVIVKNENPHIGQAKIYKCWISNEFLSNEPCE